MLKLDEKRKFKRFLYSKPAVFLLLILVFFVGRATYRVYEKERESAENLALVQKQFDDLTARQKSLNSEIQSLNSSPGVEREIREKFRVAKPGENMIVIVDDAKQGDTLSPLSDDSWWQKFLNWVW